MFCSVHIFGRVFVFYLTQNKTKGKTKRTTRFVFHGNWTLGRTVGIRSKRGFAMGPSEAFYKISRWSEKQRKMCFFFRLWTLPDGPEKKTIHLNYLIWFCINGIGVALSWLMEFHGIIIGSENIRCSHVVPMCTERSYIGRFFGGRISDVFPCA